MTPYLAVAALAFRRRISSFSELFGRAALFVIILTAWSRIWGATAFGGFHGFAPADAVWYLMATEWIVLSIPYVYLEIEADVRSGNLAYCLQRPGSYAGFQLAQAIGLGTASWIALGIVGFAMALFLTGEWPKVSVPIFVLIAILAWIAIVATSVVMVTLGMLAVWTDDAAPCAWVWQKLHFVLGGLMLPLSIYPQWVRDAAGWTPFPALLGNLTEPLVTGVAPATGMAVLHLALWSAAFVVVLFLVSARAVRRTQEG